MGLSLIPVGGYGEVGRNCTAIEVDGELFVLDLGLHLDNYVRLSDDDDVVHRFSKKLLIEEQAVPDIDVLDKDRVKAVLISHAHLDHVGAVPYLANAFPCDVHGTPFTMAVAQRLVQDKRAELRNKLVAHEYREIFPLSERVKAEFVEVTHSTPHTAAIALHTPYGVVLYLNDFKLDESPALGNRTDLDRLRSLRPEVLIIDTLYADLDEHTPSERRAKLLLENALLSRDLTGRNVLVTTFSSHVARLCEIAAIGRRMGRKVMFVGRSMAKYLEAAKEVGVSSLIDEHEVVRYGSKVRKALSKVSCFQDYLFVVTGGMGEPKAVLSRIVDEGLVPFRRNDVVVFSNRVIPTPAIVESRERLERQLADRGYELLRDLHVSGHGAGRDHQAVLDAVKPAYVVPVHGEDSQREAFRRRALRSGVLDARVLVLRNGERRDL
ncbi:MBL fold metallo-hydrolase [Candidatus Woesearchaeota archaeon]|nr:MBL fold metallo-hydrolase [Candidatus Woesearchaeota archaeon]